MTALHPGVAIDIIPNTLEAILDMQPPGPHRFYVTLDAEVEVDWKVALVPAHPQGINPQIKLLRFDVELPKGPHSNAIARRTIRFDERPAALDYTDVTVENGDETLTCKVRQVY